MSVIEYLEKMVEEQPELVVFRLSETKAKELHDWLEQYHRLDPPPFDQWIKTATFLGRKIELYATEDIA